MAWAHPWVVGACLRSAALPAMSVGAANRTTCHSGKFHGMMARITPRGSKATKLRDASVSTTTGASCPDPSAA